jgi:hypothetical protein
VLVSCRSEALPAKVDSLVEAQLPRGRIQSIKAVADDNSGPRLTLLDSRVIQRSLAIMNGGKTIGEVITNPHTLLNTVFLPPFIIAKLLWITRESKRVSRSTLAGRASERHETNTGRYIIPFLSKPWLMTTVGLEAQLPRGRIQSVAPDQQAF